VQRESQRDKHIVPVQIGSKRKIKVQCKENRREKHRGPVRRESKREKHRGPVQRESKRETQRSSAKRIKKRNAEVQMH
jgi:hypothetical protein